MSSGCVPTRGEALQRLLHSPSKSPNKNFPSNIPNSLEGFRLRTQTFTTFRWLAHSVTVSPLKCARWGWECVEADLMRCVSCRAFLYAKNDDMLSSSASDAKLENSLKLGHKSYCIWATTTSPERFLSLNFASNQECLEYVLRSLKAIIQLPLPVIPTIDLRRFPDFAAHEDVFATLAPHVHSCDHSSRDDALHALFILAICGWSLETDPRSNAMLWNRRCIKIHCEFCCRSLGLWDYKPLHPSETDPNSNVSPSPGKMRHQSEDLAISPRATAEAQVRITRERNSKTVAIVDTFRTPPLVEPVSGEYKILHLRATPPHYTSTAKKSTSEPHAKSEQDNKADAKAKDPVSRPQSLVSPESDSTKGLRLKRQLSGSDKSSDGKKDETPRQTRSSKASEFEGLTTRRGTIIRSPVSETSLSKEGLDFQKKKRQRSGDSGHSPSEPEDKRKKRKSNSGALEGDSIAEAESPFKEQKGSQRESDQESCDEYDAAEILHTFKHPRGEQLTFGTAPLDPVQEHRIWCPYVLMTHGEEQNLMGWEYVVRLLRTVPTELSTDASVSKTSQKTNFMTDNLKKARKLLSP